MRRWRRNHPEDHNAEHHAYYARHRETLKARIAAYHRANPEVVRTKRLRYRARQKDAVGSFTTAEWLRLLVKYGNACVYCGAIGALHADHRVPLSRRGTNSIDNIVPACRRCNLRKHQLTEAEFRARLEREARQRG